MIKNSTSMFHAIENIKKTLFLEINSQTDQTVISSGTIEVL